MGPRADDETRIREIYSELLDSWNHNRATRYASLFSESGSLVGFDGTPIEGRTSIEQYLADIFADHQVASYVWKVREVRFLSRDVALLRSAVGMVPPGANEINPSTNAIQSLVVSRERGGWQIAHFQNTPAQFHGRPEALEAMTRELEELL